MKVLLPEVFFKYLYCYSGVSNDPPSHRGLTEQIEDNIQPVPKSLSQELGTQQKPASKVLNKTEKKEMWMTLSLRVVSCGSLFRTLCR